MAGRPPGGADEHRLRRAADGFAAGDRYERARPGYPTDAVDHLCEALAVGPGIRVLDVAAGTGKLTRDLVARGAVVSAVEPTAGMRARLSVSLPGVRILDGTAERIPLPDSSVDAVTVAQAFHWFDGPSAVREILRVLVPGGALGLVWNVMDRQVRWVAGLQQVIHRARGESPWYDEHEWRVAFDGGSGFEPLSHRAFRLDQPVDRAGLAERVRSISFVATLPATRREAVVAAALAAAAQGETASGEFVIPYVTDVFTTRGRA